MLGKLGLTHAALGHVSLRCGVDRMLIKGKGPDEVGLRYTQPDDVIEVDFDAVKTAGPGGLQPPSEAFLHSWLYKTNPVARSVVSTYPRSVRICDDALGQDIACFMGSDQLCLMRGHGVTVTGPSVLDAAVRTIALGELVSMTYKALLLGNLRPISDENLAQFSGREEQHRTRGSAVVWRECVLPSTITAC